MRQDILHNDDGKLLIAGGDFVIGKSDQQHVQDIILSQKGEWKSNPLCGFGAINYIKGQVPEPEFKRDLKIQLSFDGYENPGIKLEGGQLDVNI